MHSCTKCRLEKTDAEFRVRNERRVTVCRECERQYQRDWYQANPEKGRAKAAASMRKMRANPERRDALLVKQREYYHAKGKHTERAYYERMKETDPWGWKVRNLRRNISPQITLAWLEALWASQGGRCALSGRELSIRTAELDRILPKSRGGSDQLENLRLVVPEANAAKSSLTDAELLDLCRDIIGNAILESMRQAA